MKSVIVGTAGHIDHGKTALVKALTGIDADRLEEEKRRGITIDLGFAHLELPAPDGESIRLGFIDVPGHERFVRNMLAGAGGIDLVLLVIAADESIKPQTREHFDICRLLAVGRGITVLTKSDLVDRETLDVVRLEVEEFLRGSFLGDSQAAISRGPVSQAPIIAVSARTGAGLADLKRALTEISLQVPSRDSSSPARLPIDRVFTMKGFGTVVTGTLIAGTILKEDELDVLPAGRRVRVRDIQVHGNPADMANAGQRTALNLAGVTKAELSRGMMLAPPAHLNATARLEVSLTLLSSARPLKDRARVHFHAYTSETIATVVLRGQRQIAPGQTAFAQLRLADPLPLLPGDRFIIRQFSPVLTIGGGVVRDATPLNRGLPPDELNAFLKIQTEGSAGEMLAARIARRGARGLTVSEAVSETGWTAERIRAIAKELIERKIAIRAADVLISMAAFESAISRTLALVTAFQKDNPLVAGINREALRERLHLSPGVFSAVVAALVGEKKLDSTGDQIRAAGRGVVMKDEEAESKKIIESAFVEAGLKTPALKDVLAGLKVDKVRAEKIVTLLLRDKILVKVSDDLVFHRNALQALRRSLSLEKTKSPQIDVARFKDLTGVTRKYAIPLLEYLDREHVTRRVGDKRLIL